MLIFFNPVSQVDIYRHLLLNESLQEVFMLHNLNEESWKCALERDSKLKELAIKAGVENNYQRAKELNGCFAFNGGRDVVKSEEEKKLAIYMFCIEDEGSPSLQKSLQGRILAAREAGIGIDDL